MELKDVLLKRRSIRKFTQETISEELIEKLLRAAMSGPSACNKRPWEFYVVTNSELLSQLRTATKFSNIEAPLAIIVCGDMSRALPLRMSEYWVQDCSAATENILLCATDLMLGAVWCGVYPQKRAASKIKKLFSMSEKHIPLNIIYIGYPMNEPEAVDRYEEKYVHYYK